jgi:hypothetical protein
VKGLGVSDLVLWTVLLEIVTFVFWPVVMLVTWANTRCCPTLGPASPLHELRVALLLAPCEWAIIQQKKAHQGAELGIPHKYDRRRMVRAALSESFSLPLASDRARPRVA